ncbi:MAG: SDR family NAD(P)-dependent oxidoreductase, partial [Thermoanaerobaculia bacterium]|nr:SDR family NAD(P)-dependent oxidoreductase [Thermoanaerobaculia bacterium]
MKHLENVRVLVTGGAGGIGLAIARAFAREGSDIVLADIDPESLRQAQVTLTQEGIDCYPLELDVTDPLAAEVARERLHDAVGPVQVLVNNAGIVHGGPFLDVSLKDHLKTYRVNVDGVVILTHAFLPDLLVAEEGHLVNIASASGFIGLPYGSTYASSKWAVIGFSESIRLELEKQEHHHVGVTTVCPSYVDTGMFEGVKPPLLTRFLTPDVLAGKIVEAVKSGQ